MVAVPCKHCFWGKRTVFLLHRVVNSRKGQIDRKDDKKDKKEWFSPLTGGKKDDTVISDSKRQRTGTVAAEQSQERGRMVQVPAYAGGEGAWEPRGGNAPPSALVTGESAFPLGERIQVGPRMDRHSP